MKSHEIMENLHYNPDKELHIFACKQSAHISSYSLGHMVGRISSKGTYIWLNKVSIIIYFLYQYYKMCSELTCDHTREDFHIVKCIFHGTVLACKNCSFHCIYGHNLRSLR